MLHPTQLAQKYPTPDPTQPSFMHEKFGLVRPRIADPEWQATGHEAKRLFTHHEALKTAWTDIYKRQQRVLQNQLLTPMARRHAVAEYARDRLARAVTGADACLAQVQAELPVIRERVQQRLAPLTAAETALDSELRAFLRTTDGETRNRVLQADERAQRAAAYAPGELSGLTPAMHAHARETWLKAHHPSALQEEHDLALGLQVLGKARASLVEMVADFVDFDVLDEVAKLEAAA